MAKLPHKLAWLQPAVATGCVIPVAVILFRAFTNRLGANPIATAMNQLGLLALILLIAALTCTPLKILFGWKWPLRVRKTLGLAGFFTALMHFLVYLLLDKLLDVPTIVEDVISRPFIAVGFLAFVILVPLAWTSRKVVLKAMGPKNWQRLHRLAYAATLLGAIHFFLRVKQDTTEPIIYGSVLMLLLLVRVFDFVQKRRRQPS